MFVQLSSTTCASCFVFDSLVPPMFLLHFSFTACIESMFLLIILSATVSDIPSSTGSFLGPTKTSHLFSLSLKLMVTTQIPNYVMTDLLYVFNFTCLLMVFLNLASVMFGKSLLDIYHVIMLFPLPVSVLYGTIILLLPTHVSNSTVNYDQFLFICTESMLTVSILPSLYSWDVSNSISFIALLLLLQHTFLKCPILPHPHMSFHTLATVSAGTLFHNIDMAGAAMSDQLEFLQYLPLLFLIFFLSNCLDSVNLFNTVVCTLCASTLFAYASTPPFVMWSSLLVAVRSSIISSNICLSFRPWMNCSFSSLSNSW